jgi:peptide/nickel transport system substrate-binding protein
MVYNGLLKFDVGPGNGPESSEASTPVPDLAESFEVSDDGLTYTFKLRQGIKFHNGMDLTTEDAAFSLNRIRSEGPEFQRSYAFTPVSDVVATDATTVTVTLSEPYAAFINQVAAAYTRIAPKSVIEELGDMKGTMIGTGPFKVDEYTRGQKFVLSRNEDYWEEGVPYLDGIDITIMPDAATQLAAFTAGQLDILTPQGHSQVGALQGTNPDIVVTEWAGMGMSGIGCNVAKPPFDDIRVRQAMFYAINQQQIIDIVHEGHGFLQRSVPPAFADWVVPYEELPLGDAPNLEKAQALLAEADLADGFDVQCKTVVRYTQQEATVASEQFKEVGINMEILDVEYGAFLEARNNSDFDLIAFGLSPFGDIEDFTYALFQTESSRNYGGWGNAELDELFAQGRAETDLETRKEIFREIQAVIAENVWIVDLARATSLEVSHPYVKDYPSAQNPERGLAFHRVWLDK